MAAVHRVAKSRARLSDFPFTFHFHALEKAMATHSSTLAWRIPGKEQPSGLPSMGSHSRTRLKRLSSSSSSQSYGFSSMYGCESWTIKKADRRRIDAFELWCWRRLLRVPWTARRSNQSILKEIRPEYSLEGLMLRLKLQYFGHLMQRTDSFEKTLMLGKTEGRRRRGRQRTEWLDGITDSTDMSLSKLQNWQWTGRPCCSPWGHKELDTTEGLN